jgi:hypothetical protein
MLELRVTGLRGRLDTVGCFDPEAKGEAIVTAAGALGVQPFLAMLMGIGTLVGAGPQMVLRLPSPPLKKGAMLEAIVWADE